MSRFHHYSVVPSWKAYELNSRALLKLTVQITLPDVVIKKEQRFISLPNTYTNISYQCILFSTQK